MRRAIFMLLTVVLAVTVAAPAAFAQNVHFINASASGVNNAGNVSVSFKIAGLGDNESITVTATADATAVYACRNRGRNFPSDPKKQTVSGPVSASGNFTSGQNGQVSGSLTLEPPASTLDCPSGQTAVLVSVSYTNAQVSAGGDTEDLGDFQRTFFTL